MEIIDLYQEKQKTIKSLQEQQKNIEDMKSLLYSIMALLEKTDVPQNVIAAVLGQFNTKLCVMSYNNKEILNALGLDNAELQKHLNEIQPENNSADAEMPF